MKALILDGKVVDIVEKKFDVHESMTWVDATDAAEVGGSYDGKVFGPADTRTNEQKAADDLHLLRSDRNSRLRETDYLALSDNTMSDDWKTYRQQLRDITKKYQSVEDEGFAWPTKPGE